MQAVTQYTKEMGLAFSLGASLSDKLRLATATLAFHAANAAGGRSPSEPRRYGIKLRGRRHELWLRTFGGDIFILHELFGTNCYTIPAQIKTPRTIVDLGANVGLSTLYLATHAPQARFICVEPDPLNADLLRRNLVGIEESTIVEAAIAQESGTRSFEGTRPAWGGGLSDKGNLTVRSISMDDLLAQHVPTGRVNLVKMDIEGAESEVLTGEMRWLDQVDCIIAELHPPYSFEKFSQALSSRGFTPVHPETTGRMPMAIRTTLLAQG